MTYYFYQIKNKINQKSYTGITINLEGRWSKHKRELRSNVHHSIRLQNAWNKYGENEFDFILLETGSYNSFLQAAEREIELINMEGPLTETYNMTNTISPMNNPKIAEKVKLLNQSKVEDVLQIDIETKEIIDIYPSLREAERETSIFRSNISKACNRNSISAGGYYWAFACDYDEFWVPKLNGKSIPIAHIDEDDEIIRVFDSAAEASRYYGLDRSNIRTSILRGGRTDHKRFIRLTHDEYYEYFKTCRDYS